MKIHWDWPYSSRPAIDASRSRITSVGGYLNSRHDQDSCRRSIAVQFDTNLQSGDVATQRIQELPIIRSTDQISVVNRSLNYVAPKVSIHLTLASNPSE